MPFKDRQKQLQYYKDYWSVHRDRYLDKKLERAFGISRDDYNALLSKQNGVCAVCFQPERMVHGKSKKVQPLGVDHDHETGAVRALLCSKCNTALGLLDEDTARIMALLEYLRSFNG